MRKMCKAHVPRVAEICLLGFLHLLSHKKPKRCKIHTPRNLNYQHFQHNRGSIMLIMSIVHVPNIKSVTMCVDGDGLLETSKTSSRPSRIVTGNFCAVNAVLLRYIFSRASIAYCFISESKKMVTNHYYILKNVENCAIILTIIEKYHNSR